MIPLSSYSWTRSWNDGSCIRRHAIRNDQVSPPPSALPILVEVASSQLELIRGYDRTKLIDDQKRDVPRYRGLMHGTLSIVKEEGIGGIYRGLFPVVSPRLFVELRMRQV